MMTEKQFEVQFDGWRYFHVADTINERCIARLDTKLDADAFLEIIKDYEELVQENEELKQSIDNMGGRLQGLWAYYNANRYEIWGRAVEDVAKELGFKIYKPGDTAISMSDLKKERINSVKKLNKRLRDLGVVIE